MKFCAGILLALTLSARQQSANPDPWDVIKKGLTEGDAMKRLHAVAAVGVLGAQPEALKIVHDALQDKSVQVRRTAAATLGEMRAPESIPYLKQALQDTDEVAFAAAKALWEMGDMSGRDLYHDMIAGERKDKPGMVTSAMRDARAKMRNPAQLALIGVREATGAFLGPAYMGVVVAEDALKDSGAQGRILAIKFLSQDSDPYALTLLEWALGDKNWAVREAAAKALAVRGNEGSIGKLEPLLSDSKEPVQYMAAAAILRLKAAGTATSAQSYPRR